MSVAITGRSATTNPPPSVGQPVDPVQPAAPPAADSLQLSGSHQAPAGRTPVGTAVNRVLWATNDGTVPRNLVFTQGTVGAITRPQHGDTWAVERHVVDLIQQARYDVRIQMYNFHGESVTGGAILDALARKQREVPGFRVYIIQNNDKSPFSNTLQQALIAHGVDAQVATFHHTLARSIDHTKQYIFDGTLGVTGGSNIGDHPELEKDLMVDVQGPVVDSLLADFDEAWKASDIHYGTQGGKPIPGLDAVPAPQKVARPAAPEVPLTFLSRPATTVWDAVTGDPYRTNSDQALLAAMGAARQSITIESPNFNDPTIWNALTAAAARGVKVRVLLPRDFNRRTASYDGASNPEAVLRIESGLPKATLADFEIRWFSYDGKTLAPNHTKYMSVDDQWTYLGSQNMDKESWIYSQESGIGIDDPAQARRLNQEVFERDWQTGIPVNPATVQLNSWEKFQMAARQAYQAATDPIGTLQNLLR